jgi:hypothetical protein
MALKTAAASKGKGKLAQAAKKRKPQPKSSLNHPTLDSPGAAHPNVYNPPKPEERFQFLKTFSTIPGLRSKGSQQPQG